ncbi:MAG: hypothetical protein ACPGQS_04895 [Bradymonadia bacterium]
MNHYRTYLILVFCISCSASENEVNTDCRTMTQQCSENFECTMDNEGRYACSPIANETHSDAGLSNDGNADVGQNTNVVDAFMSSDAESSSDEDARMVDQSPSTEDQGIASVSDDAANSRDLTDCTQIGLVGPVLPAEAGHRAATVFTPPQYPFAVEAIGYELLTSEESPSCSSRFAHKLELMVINGANGLPSDPEREIQRLRTYDVPEDTGPDDGRAIRVTLPNPLYLIEGERLVISIELAAEGERHLCLSRCMDRDAPPGTDWWSNAAIPPYSWSDLVVEYGFKGELRIQAYELPNAFD